MEARRHIISITQDKQILNVFLFPLIQTIKGKWRFFDLEYNLGYILAEKGLIGLQDHYPEYYEAIMMLFRYPLYLEDETIVPRCRIKIRVHSRFSQSYIIRRDHSRILYRLGWKRDDISNLLPTAWFLEETFSGAKIKYS